MAVSLKHDEAIYLTEEEAREEAEKIREIFEGKDRKMAEIIKDMYWNKEMSTTEIGKELGYPECKILRLMRKYNIPRRSLGGSISLAKKKAVESGKIKPLFTKEELVDLYLNKKMSMDKIALVEGCPYSTVYHYLKRYGIPIRTQKEAKRMISKTIGKEKEIADLYLNKQLSITEISEIFGISDSVVYRCLFRLNIPRRPISEALKLKYEKERQKKESEGQK